MQMAWPEGENGPPGSHHSGDALASTATARNNALPCYRTTADDYRRAVSRGREPDRHIKQRQVVGRASCTHLLSRKCSALHFHFFLAHGRRIHVDRLPV